METKAGDLEGLAQTGGKAMEQESKETAAPPTSAPKDPAPPAPVEFPDPEEDDLEDLDGLYSSLSG
jgi:predicted flap endonuclease-1-like 5' DNA nuclease